MSDFAQGLEYQITLSKGLGVVITFTMKALSLSVLKQGQPAKLLAVTHDLSSFSYFTKGSVKEAIDFFAKTAVERTQKGQRTTIQQENFTGHIYCREDGLAAAICTDAEYPQRVAFSVLAKILDEFDSKFKNNSNINPDNTNQLYPELADHLLKAQDPNSNDPFMKVQRELDETRIILHKTMDSLLQRGEKLDDLVARSDELSAQSKMFYKTAKSTNACCTYV
ncbi:Longin-like domain-containing protein [Globomyces pollinis-pini]|nr:Longin-like domain-containing protein [Globomyces pollinis-pini]